MSQKSIPIEIQFITIFFKQLLTLNNVFCHLKNVLSIEEWKESNEPIIIAETIVYTSVHFNQLHRYLQKIILSLIAIYRTLDE